jgi:hypothetical protein
MSLTVDAVVPGDHFEFAPDGVFDGPPGALRIQRKDGSIEQNL